MDPLTLAMILIAIFAAAFVFFLNSLISLRNKANNCWAQIDVQLKLRYDVVPNLVSVVKAYAKHELKVFSEVAKIRADAGAETSVARRGQKEAQLSGAISRLLAVAESYPKMRSDQHFLELMQQISRIEGKIAFARQFYNDATLEYNNAVQLVPSNIVAAICGFGLREYFQADEDARKGIIVDLKQ